MRKVLIFDTTLRDGEQGIGNLMSISQKTEIVKKLDQLGLDIIELGFPAASEEDQHWFQQAAHLNLNTKVCGFSRPVISDLKITVEALRGFKNAQIQLLGVGSHIHLEHKRKINLSEAQAELINAVDFLKSEGIQDIAVILEDASRSNKTHLAAMIRTAIENGVSTITLADTVGFATPQSMYRLIAWARSFIPSHILLGIHCHNDLGLATANTLAAISAGAELVQTTLGGIGERTGNCALEEVAATLYYKANEYHAQSKINLAQLTEAVQFVFKILEKNIPPNKPLIGEYVFSTAAGIHQNGILKNPQTYEYVRPEDFGRSRSFVVNRLSSRQILNDNQKLENEKPKQKTSTLKKNKPFIYFRSTPLQKNCHELHASY